MLRTTQAALTAVLAGAVLAVIPLTAQATTAAGTASGHLGSVNVVINGQTTILDDLAPCASTGTQQNSVASAVAGGTKYGKGTTACTPNANGAATALVKGERFETTVLRQFGGPLIRIRSYTASCNTTENGSSASIQLSGLSGVSIPGNIPANYTVRIPGASGQPPVADVIFNELIAPTPPDGSLTTHTMRIKLFPEGGQASGDIIVGSASCDPYGA